MAVRGDPTAFPSTSSWTDSTPLPESLALTSTVTVPCRPVFGAGEAMETDGGVVSGAGERLAVATLEYGPWLPAASNARTR